MKLWTRRDTLLACLSLGGAAMFNAKAQAQNWPERPIRIIVPFPVGFVADITWRKIASELTIALGQAVIIENRPGATGRIGVAEGARAAPDGYTFVVADIAQMVALPLTGAKLQYDAERDLLPIILGPLGYPVLAVAGDSKIRSLRDLKALGRPATVALGGLGGYQHMLVAMLAQLLNIEVTLIPYPNSTVIKDTMGGVVDLAITFSPEAKGPVDAGKLRLLNTFSAKRNPMFPDVPTMGENTPWRTDLPGWSGLFAPVGTPAAVVTRIGNAVRTILLSDSYVAWVESGAGIVRPLSGSEFARFIEEQRGVLKPIVASAGIKSE
jgi:tripartite-type tricarboxylate transporter receptor subunit TctC